MSIHEVLKVNEKGRVAVNRMQHLHVPFEVSEDEKGLSTIRITSEDSGTNQQRLEFGTNRDQRFKLSARMETSEARDLLLTAKGTMSLAANASSNIIFQVERRGGGGEGGGHTRC